MNTIFVKIQVEILKIISYKNQQKEKNRLTIERNPNTCIQKNNEGRRGCFQNLLPGATMRPKSNLMLERG